MYISMHNTTEEAKKACFCGLCGRMIFRGEKCYSIQKRAADNTDHANVFFHSQCAELMQDVLQSALESCQAAAQRDDENS